MSFEERQNYDLFCLGLCVVELIKKENASLTFVKLMGLGQADQDQVFVDTTWQSFSKSLTSFLTNTLIRLPKGLPLVDNPIFLNEKNNGICFTLESNLLRLKRTKEHAPANGR